MKRYGKYLCLLLLPLLLAGCVSREDADAKLARGCEAGVKSIMPEGHDIASVKERRFGPAVQGRGFRHVTLVALETGDWLEVEREHECIFEESFGFMNMGYTASIYQIRTEGKIIGKEGRDILGSTEDFIKLTDAVRRALYE